MSWMPASQAGGMPSSPSAGTARTLILVGLILELLLALLYLFVGAVTLIFGIGAFFLAAGVIGLLILYLVYVFTYRRIREGNYEGARTPTLVWTIILFLTLQIISAILFLIAYIKLGDAIRETQMTYNPPAYGATPYAVPAPAGPPQPAAPAPAAIGAPAAAAAISAPPGAPICPRCGSPTTYIAQYNRWYCFKDQLYV